jgi:hypothetical protein
MCTEPATRNFESLFKQFVTEFGGEVLPELRDAKCADFLFRKQNIVAELKTLETDARQKHAQKMQALIESWRNRGLLVAFGTVRISLPRLNPICQREWLQVLEPPIETLLRKARDQIRSTKQQFDLPTAKGLVLIANEGNLLHTSPPDYMSLVARVLRKKDAENKPRFADIQGVTYFSLSVTTPQGLPFWMSGQVNPAEDKDILALQEQMLMGWMAFLARRVRQVET